MMAVRRLSPMQGLGGVAAAPLSPECMDHNVGGLGEETGRLGPESKLGVHCSHLQLAKEARFRFFS